MYIVKVKHLATGEVWISEPTHWPIADSCKKTALKLENGKVLVLTPAVFEECAITLTPVKE